jgi:hypothetical protein
MGENFRMSSRQIKKVSVYPAHRGDRSKASQYPPHTKCARKAVRTGERPDSAQTIFHVIPFA